uniref:G-protein coupled receptor 176 n=1 Tax=Myxine glutinosa TaxID=7769 RepID=UPI00358F8207
MKSVNASLSVHYLMGKAADSQPNRATMRESSFSGMKVYRDFTSIAQVLLLATAFTGNLLMACCMWRKALRSRSASCCFLMGLASAGLGASLASIPSNILSHGAPPCCLWMGSPEACTVIRFAQRFFGSMVMLCLGLLALDRYYSILNPLEGYLTSSRARDLLIYTCVHASVASTPVFTMDNTADLFSAAYCGSAHSYTQTELIYAVAYDLSTIVFPITVALTCMFLLRCAFNGNKKEKCTSELISLRKLHSSLSLPFVLENEQEIYVMLGVILLIFVPCSLPYFISEAWRVLAPAYPGLPECLKLTAAWLPKLILLAIPLAYASVNSNIRQHILTPLENYRQCYSRRNTVDVTHGTELLSKEYLGSQPQFLETFCCGKLEKDKGLERMTSLLQQDDNIGNEQREMIAAYNDTLIVDREATTFDMSLLQHHNGELLPGTIDEEPLSNKGLLAFGPFELPPQWRLENQSSKKRLLPPLGDTPEELIQCEDREACCRCEGGLSRSNKVRNAAELNL